MKKNSALILTLCATMLCMCLASCNQSSPDPTVNSTTTTPSTTVTQPTSQTTVLQSGWVQENGKWYYYGEDHTVTLGWTNIKGQKYYFKEDGAMATGIVEIDGQKHFFGPDGMELLMVNPWNLMPEGYVPEVTLINDWQYVNVQCHDALQKMLADCRAADLVPYIASAYRTHNDQIYLYNNKIQRLINEGYPPEEAKRLAGTVVAVPGTSEHELGLAVDLVDNSYRNLDEAQENTPVQKWLMENSWKYGFILRYPSSKSEITGIIFEPWHYRYVGVTMASEIYRSGLCLEEYLESIS